MMSTMPVPVAKPISAMCGKCGEECNGHYLSNPTCVAESIAAPVPSVTIAQEFAKNETLDTEKCQKIAKKVLIKMENVQHQWDHLKQVKINRAKGVEKAKKTRAAKKKL